MSNTTKFRIYADGEVVHQDDFDEKDSELPLYDDYSVHEVPDVIIDYILPPMLTRQSK